MTTPEQLLRAIVDEIETFDKNCAEAEYTDTGTVWELLGDWHARIKTTLAERPHLGSVAISLEGGLVQDFFTDNEELRGRLDLLVIDYDTEGADEDELLGVRQSDGEYAEACVSERALARAAIGLDEINRQLDAISDDELAREEA